MRIAATREVAAPPETLFAFLADLRNHWLLTDRWVSVVELSPDVGPDGGIVELHGPFGVRRRASTRVVETMRPTRLEGIADLGGTHAAVHWSLEPHAGGTRVTLAADLLAARRRDRLLLASGGRWWLAWRFRAALERLDELTRTLEPAAEPLLAGAAAAAAAQPV